MNQSHRNPGGSPARQTNSSSQQEERNASHNNRQRTISEDRETERARYRNRAFRGKMEEGDEGQGEWEGSARNW